MIWTTKKKTITKEMKRTMNKVRVRFAPSPTGNLHIGGARTALFNYLFARKNAGTFILRIEDTDRARSSKAYEDTILEGLNWLGLEWDEGPEKGGNHGPYRQSERFDRYSGVILRLLAEKKAYHCFCSPGELEIKRQKMKENGTAPKYDGTCSELSDVKVKELLKIKKPYSIRFRTPRENVRFEDLIRGELSFDSTLLGDMVIMKSDGSPTFNFACALDDADMEITHVIRGEDHISNTPKQILMAKAIGKESPQFAHLPMILGKDRSKLSKRHGATNVVEYRALGYLPQALVNFLALLGWSHPGEKEILSPEELIDSFSLERVGKSGSIFDTSKLDWMNHYYIQQIPQEQYLNTAGKYLPDGAASQYTPEETNKILLHVRDSINTFRDIAVVTDYFFEQLDLTPQAQNFIQDIPFPDFCRIILTELDNNSIRSIKDLLPLLKKAGNESGLKGKQLYMSLRIAVTGTTEGVELQPLLEILGIDRIQDRIQNTVRKLES